MRMLIRLLLAISLLLPNAVRAETIVLGAEDAWLPYSNPDGSGLCNDIVRAAYRSVGIDVLFDVKPYNRLLKDLDANRYLGVFNVPRERSNEQRYIFGKIPHLVARSAYYQSTLRPLDATRKEDLRDVTVGVVTDYGYGDFFMNNERFRKLWRRSDTQNLQALKAGYIDSTILYEKTANRLLKELGLESDISKAFDSETGDIHVAFSKYWPRAQYYADKLDEGLAIIKANGTYDRIVDAY